MKITIVTTYIRRDGTVAITKSDEQQLERVDFVLPETKQTATITKWEDGYKIVVTKLQRA